VVNNSLTIFFSQTSFLKPYWHPVAHQSKSQNLSVYAKSFYINREAFL